MVGGNHLVYQQIEGIIADAVDRRAIDDLFGLVFAEQLQPTPGLSAVIGALAVDGGITLQFEFMAMVPGGI